MKVLSQLGNISLVVINTIGFYLMIPKRMTASTLPYIVDDKKLRFLFYSPEQAWKSSTPFLPLNASIGGPINLSQPILLPIEALTKKNDVIRRHHPSIIGPLVVQSPLWRAECSCSPEPTRTHRHLLGVFRRAPRSPRPASSPHQRGDSKHDRARGHRQHDTAASAHGPGYNRYAH